MKIFKFFSRFIPQILSGEKTATTRDDIKDVKKGDDIYIVDSDSNYAVAKATVKSIVKLSMDDNGQNLEATERLFDLRMLHNLPQMEGFESWGEYRDFVKNHYGFPFRGFVLVFENVVSLPEI